MHTYISHKKLYVAKFICPYSSAQLYIQKQKYRYKSRFVRYNHPLSVISLNRANILYLKNMEIMTWTTLKTRFTWEELSQSHFWSDHTMLFCLFAGNTWYQWPSRRKRKAWWTSKSHLIFGKVDNTWKTQKHLSIINFVSPKSWVLLT